MMDSDSDGTDRPVGSQRKIPFEQRSELQDLDKGTLGNRSTGLSGVELEDYCKRKGLCPLCATTRIRKRVFQLFKKNKWEAVTELNKDGSYRAYKGYCVGPKCFTLEQAKYLVGDIINESEGRHEHHHGMGIQRKRSRRWLHEQVHDSDDDSHVEGFMSGNHATHKHVEDSFPPLDLKDSVDYDISTNQPLHVTEKTLERLKDSSNIHTLELSGIKLRQIDYEILSRGLEVNTSLSNLILESAQLDDTGLSFLSEGLAKAKDIPLVKLYLRSNSIGDTGVEGLAQFLQANTTLEKFDISRNSVSSKGALSIFSALFHNRLTRIRSLNLANNTLTDMTNDEYGVEQFLKRNRTLRILNLEGNRIEDESIKKIASGLQQNEHTVLERLYLGWNGIGDHATIALAEMLETNQSLRVLGLGENLIQSAGARAILLSLDQNKTLRDISGLWRNKIDRRFLIFSIRKLLLSHRQKQISRKAQEQPVINDPVMIDVEFDLEDPTESNNPYTLESPSLRDQEDIVTRSRKSGTSNRSDRSQLSSSTGNNRYDHLVILQATPLITFNREAAINEAIPLIDSNFEVAVIQEALTQVSSSCKIDAACKIATPDTFSSFFEKKSDAHILHLSCTGLKSQFTLENGFGATQTISLADLTRLIFYMNVQLQVIVVSSPQAKSIGQLLVEAGMAHVVCCQLDSQYRDLVGMDFLSNLYRALAGKKSLRHAFQTAQATARNGLNGRSKRRVADRFYLLPEYPDTDTYHKIPVFFAQDVTPMCTEASDGFLKPLLSIPNPPQHFVGRELEIYEIVEAIRAVDIVRVVGGAGAGKKTVACAACHFIWHRRDHFNIDEIMWLPALGANDLESDTVYADLNYYVNQIVKATTNIWDTAEELLECQDRIQVEIEDRNVLFVLDQREFVTQTSQNGLESMVSFLINAGISIKIILIETYTGGKRSGDAISLVSGLSRDTTMLPLEEVTVEIDSLSLASTTRLFGNHCRFLMSGGCPAAHTSEELAAWIEVGLSSTFESTDISPWTTKRRKELFERMGQGIPQAVIDQARGITSANFLALIQIFLQPETYIDSLVALEQEVDRRTLEQLQAVEDENYLWAHRLDELLEDLEILRLDYPDVNDLKKEQKHIKEDLEEAIRKRRYDIANNLKRDLVNIKRKIRNEQERTLKSSANTTSLASPQKQLLSLKEQVQTMVLNTEEEEDMLIPPACLNSLSLNLNMKSESFAFAIPCGDHRDCSFIIKVGSMWTGNNEGASIGHVVWTNEACHLADQVIEAYGGAALEKELLELPVIDTTEYGDVRCAMGNAVLVGPFHKNGQEESASNPTCLLLTVGPFLSKSHSIDDGDNDDDDIGRTPLPVDTQLYRQRMLRSCYRSSMLLAKHAQIIALNVPLLTESSAATMSTQSLVPAATSQNDSEVLKSLHNGLQTLVEEVPYTFLRELYITVESISQAQQVQHYLRDNGYASIH